MWRTHKDLGRRRRDIRVIQDPSIVPVGVSSTVPLAVFAASAASVNVSHSLTPTVATSHNAPSNAAAAASTNNSPSTTSNATTTASQPTTVSFYTTAPSPLSDTTSLLSSTGRASPDSTSYANVAPSGSDTMSVRAPPTPSQPSE